MIDIIKASNTEAMQKVWTRSQLNITAINDTVRNIIDQVINEKDTALYRFTEQFDGVRPANLKLDGSSLEAATEKLDEALLEALKQAAKNIRAFHGAQKPKNIDMMINGGRVEQRFTPLESVGLYIPGGTAAYPSTVLMSALPAKIAGVKNIVMITPPQKNGTVNPAILAAARIAGIDAVYTIGGAQGIAALAYGTESIPRVDKIVGPGNIYVAVAKQMVSIDVGIDMVAGPSEIAIIADETANPAFVAADLLSQAEHDPDAAAVLFTSSESFGRKVRQAVIRQTEKQPRRKIIEAALKDNGAIVITESLNESIRLVNKMAPEHLEIITEDPRDVAAMIVHAGAIFLGPWSAEPLGDYMAGPNHTLPTSGTARFKSALSTTDFYKATSIIDYDEPAFNNISEAIKAIANSEALYAHAAAITIRQEKEGTNE